MNGNVVDVLVAGGGPAGCALALHLARAGCSVALLERTDYDGFRVGESLPPSAVPRLMRLGVWDSFLETQPAPVHGVQSAWGTAELESSSFLANPFGNGWHLDRSRFDAMLSSAVENAGARIFRRTIARSFSPAPRGLWSVTGGAPTGEIRFLSRFLVDASGRSAHVCARLGAGRRAVDRMVGIGMLFSEGPFRDILPSLVEAHPLGWWYSAGLPGARTIAIFFTDADLCACHRLTNPAKWRSVLEESQHTRDRLSACVPAPVLQVFPAASHCLDKPAGDSWLAIGDALAARDPLSSSGIDFALASAERASSVLHALANSDQDAAGAYNAAVASDFAGYLDQRRAIYGFERRWPDSPFWQRRHEFTARLRPGEEADAPVSRSAKVLSA